MRHTYAIAMLLLGNLAHANGWPIPPSEVGPTPLQQEQIQDMRQDQGQQQSQDQAQQQDQRQDQAQTALSDSRSAASSNNNVEIKDKRQAPGISTAYDSVGFSFPGGALNLPWTWGDRKKMPVCNALLAMGQTEQAFHCVCMTSVMKTLHETEQHCKDSYVSTGGGSDPK